MNIQETLSAFSTLVAEIEAEVLRRHHASLPKIEGKEIGETFFELDQKVWRTNGRWKELTDSCKADYAKIETELLSSYQLAPPEPKKDSAVEKMFSAGFYLARIYSSENRTYARIETNGQSFEAYVNSGSDIEIAAEMVLEKFKQFAQNI